MKTQNSSFSHRFQPAFWLGLVVLACSGPVTQAAGVLDSMHNLSATGPGPVGATTNAEVCMFCHASHKTQPKLPLWNHASSGATYIPYSSSTLKANVGQPTGSSRLCLSCHDGTVALASQGGGTNFSVMRNNVTTMPRGHDNLGTDLSGDHPVSFVYDVNLAAANPQLKNPGLLPSHVKLDEKKQLQCTTCHDPHDNRFGKFMVQDNQAGALCMACHNQTGWPGSAHNLSAARWNGQGSNPWPTNAANSVQANGCENCHIPHNAQTKPRLLAASSLNQSCCVCHNGNVAAKNLQAEFTKLSVHPVELTAHLHDPAEDPVNSPRHASCADCHNPHAARLSGRETSAASGPLAGVKGIGATGALVNPATRQFQLCFRCHGDSPNKEPSLVNRQFPQTNKRLQFAPANASFHPVESAGRNSSVPSLIAPYTVSSVISCTDCHNNDQGPAAGGTGPQGPHGSIYAPLLERRLTLADLSPESGAAYALCYKCHSRSSILSNQSFPGHADHVVKYQTACTTCHDSHGVPGEPGLINFNTAYVTAGPNRRLVYTSTGPNRAACTLTCHGSVHNNFSYDFPIPALKRVAKH